MLHIPSGCCCKCFQLCILLLLFLLLSTSTCSPWGQLYRKHVRRAACRDTQVRPVAEHPRRIYHLCSQEAGNRDTQLGLLMMARSAQWTCAASLASEPFSSSSSPRPISMECGGKYSVHGGALAVTGFYSRDAYHVCKILESSPINFVFSAQIWHAGHFCGG